MIQLPSHSPELNPVEAVLWLLKRGEIASRVLVDLGHIASLVRCSMSRVGYRPDLLEGFLAATGPTLRRSS
ncbi:transposase [Frankia sp. R82]|uniref:transposase n=1 Tax=Frankia sp. R82 TaxID=2950553 RepID=UPI00204416D5|nr:transposase [Frankia sp. R82]MCM3883508.1 transposase [Frankia sp. R82]